MLHVGIPVMDGHELTQKCVRLLAAATALRGQVSVVIIDNDSVKPYRRREFGELPFPLTVVRKPTNIGYYRPILDVAKLATQADIVALMHNDLFIKEQRGTVAGGNDWSSMLREAFVSRPDLGMVGFFGSNEVDDRGGRGGGSMCWFAGEEGQTQAAGRFITDLQPALILDSLFMAVRASCVPLLGVDEHTPICHFVDKVWPLRLIDQGWKVGALGVRVDHLGGQTATGARFDESAKAWCIQEGITEVSNTEATATEPGGLMLYLEAEHRFLTEMRAKRLVPSTMRGWEVVRRA